jgi:hypothetical protein
MPGAWLRSVGPEEKQQLISAAPMFAGCGKHGEQRQSAVLVSGFAEEGVVLWAGKRERPERP